jgi:tetratricopeptide (TPR) repeat protein
MPPLKLPQLPQPQTEAPAEVPAAPIVMQGTTKELFRDAVDALQHGDSEKARRLLRQVLVLEPNHKQASGLLAQIDADPIQMLGRENFSYKVQPRDTLSLIAKRFLGDPFKFYILARYNNIVISDDLEAGRTIRIPGKRPPAIDVAPIEHVEPADQIAPETVNLRLSEAKALYHNGHFSEAAKVLENLRREESNTKEVDELLIMVYSNEAKKLADSGRVEQAKNLLSKASTTYPGNEGLKRQTEQIDAHLGAEQIYKEGNQWLNEGQAQKAYEAYKRALKLEPNHAAARAALQKIKPQVVQAYYADSIRARRRQDFVTAIDNLDRLLEIEPDHELAKINRIEIKAILDREQAAQRRQEAGK